MVKVSEYLYSPDLEEFTDKEIWVCRSAIHSTDFTIKSSKEAVTFHEFEFYESINSNANANFDEYVSEMISDIHSNLIESGRVKAV